ncbi:MAG: recombinase family protein [Acidimicrobiaceae bacterium]|nr:recombinase family protein [Acidimicrobiaceae bacterium]
MPPNSATAIYARISDDRGDGAGVARQLADCRTLCGRHPKWGAPTEFVDNHISAWKAATRRPRYRAMLDGVRAGEIVRIVVYHVDRLYRQPRELEELIDLADAGQVEVLSVVGGEIDLRSSDGRFLARILVGVAAKESDDKSRRIRRQKQQQREQGVPSGGPRAFGWLDYMTPDPEEASILLEAVDAILAGESLNALAKRWNKLGVRQPQSGRSRWSSTGVRQVLDNPRNAGLMSYRPHLYVDERRVHSPVAIVGQARWPAIIPRERWEAVQRVLKTRGDRHRYPRRRSLLTGLVVCGNCGATMTRAVGRKRTTGVYSRHYWACPSRATGDACGRLSIDANGLESLIVDGVLQALDSPDLLAASQELEEHEGDMPQLLGQLEALDSRHAEVAARYASGAIPVSMLEQVCQLIENDRDRIQKELARLAGAMSLHPFVTQPGLVRQRWPSLDLDARRAILSAAIGQVRIEPSGPRRGAFDPDRVVISWKI